MIRFIDLITAELLQPGGRDLLSKTLECAMSTKNKKNCHISWSNKHCAYL